MLGLPKGLFDFQEECSIFLMDTTANRNSKQIITVKAPTGAGKTIILIDYIDRYLNVVNPNTAFVWLCPGKGDLEEQSRKKMMSHLPMKATNSLQDVLLAGFEAGTTTFINWELITKKDNKAISESEKKNLFERIAEAHRKQRQFIIIIDEEHSNDTKKANDIINNFAAKNIIRVSATARQNKLHEFYEIDEMHVISSGLITKALYINEGFEGNAIGGNEHNYLIELADEKRKQISEGYTTLKKPIRPLVIIQFPNSSNLLVEAVEKKLAEMGYTYINKMVAKWFSDDKRNIDGITETNAAPIFLLMKQAIATGWDCPRAKILVKLRENMDEDFEIQTIGRLRRMPEAKHYDMDVLDFCYLYTFDEKYKEAIKQGIIGAYETKRVFLKDKCKTFTLEKQFRDLDFDGLGERETFFKVYDYFVNKYNLTKNKKDNTLKLKNVGYVFGENITGFVRQGEFITTASILNENIGGYIPIGIHANTHTHGIELLHSIDEIKRAIGMQSQKAKTILERLFRDNNNDPRKIVALNSQEYYAFIINNVDKLKEEFRGATSEMIQQLSFSLTPKTGIFKLPEQELYRYDPTETDVEELLSNAYQHYSTAMIVSGIRSKSERLFERECENRDDIEWVYKNGDTGQQYFSIVYFDGLGKQHLFYADYIIKKTNGDIWIIETKGGETAGSSNNIDRNTANKFEAFKQYAKKNGLHWGFVRERNEDLKINNTEYTESMQSEHWVKLSKAF